MVDEHIDQPLSFIDVVAKNRATQVVFADVSYGNASNIRQYIRQRRLPVGGRWSYERPAPDF